MYTCTSVWCVYVSVRIHVCVVIRCGGVGVCVRIYVGVCCYEVWGVCVRTYTRVCCCHEVWDVCVCVRTYVCAVMKCKVCVMCVCVRTYTRVFYEVGTCVGVCMCMYVHTCVML